MLRHILDQKRPTQRHSHGQVHSRSAPDVFNLASMILDESTLIARLSGDAARCGLPSLENKACREQLSGDQLSVDRQQQIKCQNCFCKSVSQFMIVVDIEGEHQKPNKKRLTTVDKK